MSDYSSHRSSYGPPRQMVRFRGDDSIIPASSTTSSTSSSTQDHPDLDPRARALSRHRYTFKDAMHDAEQGEILAMRANDDQNERDHRSDIISRYVYTAEDAAHDADQERIIRRREQEKLDREWARLRRQQRQLSKRQEKMETREMDAYEEGMKHGRMMKEIDIEEEEGRNRRLHNPFEDPVYEASGRSNAARARIQARAKADERIFSNDKSSLRQPRDLAMSRYLTSDDDESIYSTSEASFDPLTTDSEDPRHEIYAARHMATHRGPPILPYHVRARIGPVLPGYRHD